MSTVSFIRRCTLSFRSRYFYEIAIVKLIKSVGILYSNGWLGITAWSNTEKLVTRYMFKMNVQPEYMNM